MIFKHKTIQSPAEPELFLSVFNIYIMKKRSSQRSNLFSLNNGIQIRTFTGYITHQFDFLLCISWTKVLKSRSMNLNSQWTLL